MAEALVNLLDNPILMRHVRARLRPHLVLPWAVIVLVICFCILYGGYVSNSLHTFGPLGFVLFLQITVLGFIGAQQISASVGGARASGVIDFHRVSPLSPVATVAGFFLGAPIREYVMAAITLPFALFLGFLSPAGLAGVAGLELSILLGAWIFHASALLGALVTKRPKATGGGAVIGVIVVSGILGQTILASLGGSTLQMAALGQKQPFFGLQLPWLLIALFFSLPALYFLLLPSVRKIRSERVHGYTKRQAVACMATFIAFALGACWAHKGMAGMVLALLYIFVALGVVLVVPLTPSQTEYVRGLRRAIRDGRLRPSFWSDEGVNRMGVGLLAVLATVGATVAWEAIEGRGGERSLYSQSIAVGALVIAYFGLGLQFFLLRFPKRGASYFALFIFFAWMLPLMLGLISVAAGSQDHAPTIFSVSPAAGIALSAGLLGDDSAEPSRFATLLPAVTFTVAFFFLLDASQRRLDRSVRATMPRVELDPWSTPELDPEPPAAAKYPA